MKILLNDEAIEGVETAGATLGGVLVAVQNGHIGEDRVVSAVFVDGQALTAELLGQWKDRPCSEFREARIEAPRRRGLAIHGLRVLAEGLGQSQADRERIVELFNQGHVGRGMNELTGYLTLWNNTQITLGSAARLLEVQIDELEVPAGQGSVSVGRRLGELTEQLGQLKGALEAEDFVLLADVLAYEFEPLAEDWRVMLERLAAYFEGAVN